MNNYKIKKLTRMNTFISDEKNLAYLTQSSEFDHNGFSDEKLNLKI
jgi:hypothetical protein